jgi:hypothetical protein
MIAHGKSPSLTNHAGSSDLKQARRCLPPGLTLGQVFALAQQLIRTRRSAFDRLRDALDAHDVLETTQLVALLGPRPKLARSSCSR